MLEKYIVSSTCPQTNFLSDCHSATIWQSFFFFLPSSIPDRGTDSVLSTCLTYEMGSLILAFEMRCNIRRDRDEGNQTIKCSPPETCWGKHLLLSSRPLRQGPGNRVFGNLPRVHSSCPLPALWETKLDNPRVLSRSQTQPVSLSNRLPDGQAACGLDLVPTYILLGPYSLEKNVC